MKELSTSVVLMISLLFPNIEAAGQSMPPIVEPSAKSLEVKFHAGL